MNGGVSICHVYGHFIAVVGYNKDNNTYLVYDSAASYDRRHTYAKGTWLTENELHDGAYMDVDWFCLITKNCSRNTTINDYQNKLNGRAEFNLSYDLSKKEYPIITGTANINTKIKKYYYSMCPSNKFDVDILEKEYPLTALADNKHEFSSYFGELRLDNYNIGNYFVFVYVESYSGLKVCIAQIRLNIFDTSSTPNVFNKIDEVININQDINKNESLSLSSLNDNVVFDLSKCSYIAILTNDNINQKLIITDGNNSHIVGHNDYYDDKYGMVVYLNGAQGLHDLVIYNTNDDIINVKSIKLFNNENKYYSSNSDGNHKKIVDFNNDLSTPILIEEECIYLDESYSPTCLLDGHNYKCCVNCGYVLIDEEVKKLGHKLLEIFYNDEGHFKICARCNEEYDYESHDLYLSSNRTKHFNLCKECGYSGSFENHDFDTDTHKCKICDLLDPNYKEPLPSDENNQEHENETEMIDALPKKGCKKNIGIYITQLLTIASFAYIFIKKH